MSAEKAEDVRAPEGVSTLWRRRVVRQARHQGGHDGLHVHCWLDLGIRLERRIERLDVKLIGEDLNHNLQQVLLRHSVPHGHDVLHDPGQRGVDVVVYSHPLQLAEPPQVGPDERAEVVPLLLPSGLVLGRTLVLDPHPQPVALHEIAKDKVECVVDVATFALELGPGVGHLVLEHLRDVVPQEEPAQRVLYALGELVDIREDLLRGRLLGLHIALGHRRQEVQPRQDVPGTLDGLVQVYHFFLVPARVAEEIRQVLHLSEDLHVELVIILRRQQRRSQLTDHVRSVLEGLPNIVRLDRPLHVKSLLLDHGGGLVEQPLLVVAARLRHAWLRHERARRGARSAGRAANISGGRGAVSPGALPREPRPGPWIKMA
mmetsp:Transcript_10099/g.26945  ORF Transcript_10099/g.26945 Transcript_10099/m.26945 type:complete len:374 (-) Transcript_10099:2-1123(-)